MILDPLSFTRDTTIGEFLDAVRAASQHPTATRVERSSDTKIVWAVGGVFQKEELSLPCTDILKKTQELLRIPGFGEGGLRVLTGLIAGIPGNNALTRKSSLKEFAAYLREHGDDIHGRVAGELEASGYQLAFPRGKPLTTIGDVLDNRTMAESIFRKIEDVDRIRTGQLFDLMTAQISAQNQR